MMFPSQSSFSTYYRKPLPRVFSWAFRNPSKTKLGSSSKNRLKDVTTSNSSSDTMTSLDTPHTNGATKGAVHDGETASTTSTPSPFDPTIFKGYLLALLPPLLAAAPHELDYLFDDEFNDRVQRFASEGGGAPGTVRGRCRLTDGRRPRAETADEDKRDERRASWISGSSAAFSANASSAWVTGATSNAAAPRRISG